MTPGAPGLTSFGGLPQAPGIPTGPPPLPGGVTAVVRWFFHVPQWIQMAGGILAAITALYLAWFLWKRKGAIWRWLSSRALAMQLGFALVVAVFLSVFAAAASVSWDYMMHDNDFCTACHVMGTAFQRFTDSEHAELNCHDCHQQSIFASARQMHLWIVERPEEIPEHAPVPTATCTDCHATGRDSTWQRVLATAGHRTHLESDSTALDDVMCVTCHGQEVHRFIPATQTCAQAGCHAEEDTKIVLGKMTEVTGFHCISCHEFTRPVDENATRDTAQSGLTPRFSGCTSCHEMEELLPDFDAATEPHGGVCGDCHDPHTQETPQGALVSCANGGCHAGVDTLSAFHRGLGPGALDDCLSCHVAHSWAVDGGACLDCHADVLGRPRTSSLGGRTGLAGSHRGAPNAAVLGIAGAGAGFVAGVARPLSDADWFATARHVASASAAAADTVAFDHLRHANLECTDCHSSERSHGELMVRAPADCATCHHRDPVGQACSTCHETDELSRSGPSARDVEVTIASVPGRRTLFFAHDDHEELSCQGCHTEGASGGVTLSADVDCNECHTDHHTPEATCSACHTQPPTSTAHTVAVHESLTCGGNGCHAPTQPTGVVATDLYSAAAAESEACLSCHVEQATHEPGSNCASCHLIPARAARGED